MNWQQLCNLFCAANSTRSLIDDSKPIIRPAVKYLVFQPGSTFNLTCEVNSGSKENVTWELPESRNPPSDEQKTSVSRMTWARSENGFKSVVTLTVSNATYADTGYYKCLNLVNEKLLISKQYVFIQGFVYTKFFTVKQNNIPSYLCY